jgi:hypothetical protein
MKQDNDLHSQLLKLSPTMKGEVLEKFILAALGSIPWVGGFISALVSIKTDESKNKSDELQTKWLKEHENKLVHLGITIKDIIGRFESLGDEINERIQSQEYLDIVRKAFRVWEKSDTQQKRGYVANIISNSASTNLCSDDVIRLFIDWLDNYHEIHFLIIREIFQKPQVTRYGIWESVSGEFPQDDSAEADLFKLIIRDLSTGGVIRQERETNLYGQFVRSSSRQRRGNTLESAFEDTKPYVLTELGRQFVHYTMNDVVTRIANVSN